jgi:hypothetical protein
MYHIAAVTFPVHHVTLLPGPSFHHIHLPPIPDNQKKTIIMVFDLFGCCTAEVLSLLLTLRESIFVHSSRVRILRPETLATSLQLAAFNIAEERRYQA